MLNNEEPNEYSASYANVIGSSRKLLTEGENAVRRGVAGDFLDCIESFRDFGTPTKKVIYMQGIRQSLCSVISFGLQSRGQPIVYMKFLIVPASNRSSLVFL